jgi:hypothetical protein
VAYLPATMVMFVVSGATAQLVPASTRRARDRRADPGRRRHAGPPARDARVELDRDPAGLCSRPSAPGFSTRPGSALALSALPEHQSGLAAGVNDTSVRPALPSVSPRSGRSSRRDRPRRLRTRLRRRAAHRGLVAAATAAFVRWRRAAPR